MISPTFSQPCSGSITTTSGSICSASVQASAHEVAVATICIAGRRSLISVSKPNKATRYSPTSITRIGVPTPAPLPRVLTPPGVKISDSHHAGYGLRERDAAFRRWRIVFLYIQRIIRHRTGRRKHAIRLSAWVFEPLLLRGGRRSAAGGTQFAAADAQRAL